MRQSRLFVFGALAAAFGWLLAGGCSSSGGDSDAGIGGRPGSGGSLGNLAGASTIVMPDAAGDEGGTGSSINPLCGDGTCLPDDEEACADYAPATGGAGEGGAGNTLGGAAGGGASSVGEGGAAGDHSGAAGQGGEGGDRASGGAAGQGAGGGVTTGGIGGGGGTSAAVPGIYGCQVGRDNNQTRRQCLPVGTGKESAPCFSATDCAAGFACVTEGEAGRCLPYCCAGDGNCGMGTYCAERPLRTAVGVNGVSPTVPVCVPADDCSLEEEFPCPPGKVCRCPEGTACLVVRGDSTTTCLPPPGNGMQGDACPCAWNHVCSSVTNECVKICQTDPARDDCRGQRCQASSELPQNFGVCVGPVK